MVYKCISREYKRINMDILQYGYILPHKLKFWCSSVMNVSKYKDVLMYWCT